MLVSQKGVYLFYNPLVNFFISIKQEVSVRANDANKHIDWLIFFSETVIGPGLERLSCQMKPRNAP